MATTRARTGVLLATLLLGAALAGCTDDAAPPDPVPGALATSVRITEAPATVAPNAEFQVCFRVEGKGTVPHVAVHADVESHADDPSFAAYQGQAAYPNGRASPAPEGYTLPGTFCTSLTAPATGTLYYRGHAIDSAGAPGRVSSEASTRVVDPSEGPAVTGVTMLSAPRTQRALADALVCWRVDGHGSVPHVAVHTDVESRASSATSSEAVTFTAYKGAAFYPDNRTDIAGVTFDLPARFCTNVKMPERGALHVRAHAIDSRGPPGVLADRELKVDVMPRAFSATITEVPETAAPSSTARVCWSAEGHGNVLRSTLHHDNVSHPNVQSFVEYRGGIVHPDNERTARRGGYALPGTFCASVVVPESGSLFLRANIIDGEGPPGIFSEERRIDVRATGPTSVTLLPHEATGAAGSATTVCWRVEGAGTVPHVALHVDNASHADNPSFAAYKGGAVYPGNATSAAPEGYALPGTFCAAVTLPDAGALYFRAHAMTSAGPPGLVSSEGNVAVQ